MNALRFCVLALLPLLSFAGELRGLRYEPLPGGTRLTLELSAPTVGKVFTLKAPDRLVIDLPATALRTSLGRPTGNTPVRDVRSGPQAGGGLRLVLDLAAPVQWREQRLPAGNGKGPRVQIDVLAGGTHAAVATVPPAVRAPSVTPVARASPAAAPATRAAPALPKAGPAVKRVVSTSMVTVVIDAGHGGHDVGAVGPGRLYEKHVTLALARELATQIKAQRGMRAVLTRSGDVFVPLRQRTAVAHKHKADLFVSIHADAFKNPSARGSGVYALSETGATSEAARLLAARENAADLGGGLAAAGHDRVLRSVLLDLSQNATIESSLRLADRLLDRLSDVNRLHRADVQQANFMVLKSPQVPSVLVEAAFISNPEEARKLADPAFRRRLASALVVGLRDYLQSEPRLRQALANAQAGRTSTARSADGGG